MPSGRKGSIAFCENAPNTLSGKADHGEAGTCAERQFAFVSIFGIEKESLHFFAHYAYAETDIGLIAAPELATARIRVLAVRVTALIWIVSHFLRFPGGTGSLLTRTNIDDSPGSATIIFGESALFSSMLTESSARA